MRLNDANKVFDKHTKYAHQSGFLFFWRAYRKSLEDFAKARRVGVLLSFLVFLPVTFLMFTYQPIAEFPSQQHQNKSCSQWRPSPQRCDRRNFLPVPRLRRCCLTLELPSLAQLLPLNPTLYTTFYIITTPSLSTPRASRPRLYSDNSIRPLTS